MRIRPKTLLLLASPPLLLVAAAYLQWGAVGLPTLAPISELAPANGVEPHGFPAWLRITHYLNFMLLILLIRSGLQILMDHSRPPAANTTTASPSRTRCILSRCWPTR